MEIGGNKLLIRGGPPLIRGTQGNISREKETKTHQGEALDDGWGISQTNKSQLSELWL